MWKVHVAFDTQVASHGTYARPSVSSLLGQEELLCLYFSVTVYSVLLMARLDCHLHNCKPDPEAYVFLTAGIHDELMRHFCVIHLDIYIQIHIHIHLPPTFDVIVQR